MFLSAALLLLWAPTTAAPKLVSPNASTVTNAKSEPAKLAAVQPSLPDAPIAKASDESSSASDSSPEVSAPAIQPFLGAPAKPVVERPEPTATQKKLWYTFMAVGHGAAVFDAWSTRRAISANDGTEGDPLLRPFAHSNAIYAATQISPAVMDFLGRRMMTSSHPMLRRFWWVPQVAGASFSFSAGAHNYSLTQ